MRLVLMGMPGVGKGTQATRLRDRLAVPHVSTGDILRDAIREGTPLGRKVRDFLDAGELVPDELIGDLIVERLGRSDAAEGFILDGFPRTAAQVAILDRVLHRLGVALDGAFLLAAEEEEIVRRLTGRRVCPSCSAVYHLETKAPRSAGVCDKCGSALVQRPDDTEDVIRDRLFVYREQTLPIAEIYRERGMLRQVDATGLPDEVFEKLTEAMELS